MEQTAAKEKIPEASVCSPIGKHLGIQWKDS